MREIKFRAKRYGNEQWIYGFYSACVERGDNGGVEHLYRETTTVLHYISDIEGVNHVVHPETAGQYTGLNDKNGKEIYEGDVVKIAGNYPYDKFCYGQQANIIWYANGWCIDLSDYYPLVKEGICKQIIGDMNNYFLVIGNIYDNPELLEVGK